jgi:hypothetical protein
LFCGTIKLDVKLYFNILIYILIFVKEICMARKNVIAEELWLGAYEPKEIKCPQCDEVIFFTPEQSRYMVGNIIVKSMEGTCGCGARFTLHANYGVIWKSSLIE